MTKICTINIESLYFVFYIIKHNSQTEFTNQSILHAVLAIGIFVYILYIYIRIYVFECCMLDFFLKLVRIICTGTFFQNHKYYIKHGERILVNFCITI